MAWIKRNLYFVISVVVGLGLTGYCGYLLYTALSASSTEKEAYFTATNSLYQLQVKKPFPNKENIQVAEADAERVRAFQREFLKAFAGFPTPPKVDDSQFKEYLEKTIFQFGADATNSGVGLNPGYAFGFSSQMAKLNYPSECIAPWMQELEEIKAILRILYNAKINFLEKIKRPSVSQNDNGGDDYTQFSPVTNQNGVVTPYRVEFRAFSAEIADVLAGIAASSNCFMIKAPFVVKSLVPLPDVATFEPPPPPPPQLIYRQPPPREMQLPGQEPNGPGGFGRDRRDYRFRPPERQQFPVSPAPVAPPGPVTILREKPLFVTLYLDVVKLKALETNAPAPVARTRTAER